MTSRPEASVFGVRPWVRAGRRHLGLSPQRLEPASSREGELPSENHGNLDDNLLSAFSPGTRSACSFPALRPWPSLQPPTVFRHAGFQVQSSAPSLFPIGKFDRGGRYGTPNTTRDLRRPRLARSPYVPSGLRGLGGTPAFHVGSRIRTPACHPHRPSTWPMLRYGSLEPRPYS